MGGSEKTTENEQENDNHMMTNTSWKDPHVVDRTRNERAFGMSLRARRVLDACIIHFEAVGWSRLLILAPLSSPGIKSRIREKIPGGLEDNISWQSLCKI